MNFTKIYPENIRKEFPVFQSNYNKHPLVYFDNAATTQKPNKVIDSIGFFYKNYNSNVGRGIYDLGTHATNLYSQARYQISKFINANQSEIIFTRNTTESLNLISQTWGKANLHIDDEIILSIMEHHANIVPWQILAEQKGCMIKFIDINSVGEMDKESLMRSITEKSKILSITHASNVLGTINPIKKVIEIVRIYSPCCIVIIDGTQAVSHFAVDVKSIDCDFYAFTGHKLFGPTGIGVLYGKKDLLNGIAPYQYGGNMIKSVSLNRATFKKSPEKFEAGTPHISGAIGLAAAVNFLAKCDQLNLYSYEERLLAYAMKSMSKIPELSIYGKSTSKISLISFAIRGIHSHDIGTILDSQGICIRTGHHCAMPLMRKLKVASMARVSFSFYNTFDEIDYFVKVLNDICKFFH